MPAEAATPLSLFAAIFVVFMAFIAKNGIFYAGLRHWLFAIPLLAIFAAVCSALLLRSRYLWLRALPVLAILWIAVTVLPQRRIWEYHNIIAGGSAEAWRSFDNESVDLGQRSNELVDYVKTHISPTQPILAYWTFKQQLDANGIHDWDPTPDQVGDGHITGWMLVRAPSLPVNNWHGAEILRNLTPTDRRGDLLIYHGTFYLPQLAAGTLTWNAFRLLEEKGGDPKLAESYFQRAVKLNPEIVPAWIELGNFALRRHQRDQALNLYQQALLNETHSPDVRADIAKQIALVKNSTSKEIPPMRSPAEE
jgi:tetratricopeptide (TPR) repeat protein